MANRKNKNRNSKTSRAKWHRRRLLSLPPPPPPVRVIMSTISIGILLDLVLKHNKTCIKPKFTVDGQKSQLLHISCTSCGKVMTSPKDSKESHGLSLSNGFAAGALCSGVGYAALNYIFSTLEIPILSKTTYLKAEEEVGKEMKKSVEDSCKKNGEKERRLAIEAGDVISVEGVEYPFINVTVDAGWSKRSYGHSYNSNAGVAVIIGIMLIMLLYKLSHTNMIF
jgi:hypothetical protein